MSMKCASRTVPARQRPLQWQQLAQAGRVHRIGLPVRLLPCKKQNQQSLKLFATPPSTGSQPVKPEDEFDGLLPEEDFEVPGTYFDALSSSTKLGKAVKAAVEELEHLGNLEAEVLTECDDLLKKLGMKGSLFGAGDNPLAKLQQELEELERMEQEELVKQQQAEQQKDKSQS